MNRAIISFVISALVGIGAGYFAFNVLFGSPGHQTQAVASNNTSSGSQAKADSSSNSTSTQSAGATASVSQADNIIVKRGCIQCHSVGALNIKGGQVGPDLSNAYNEVQSQHGLPIEKFLTKPNSAVMSGVLGSRPLTNDQRQQVIALLKKASQVKQ